MRTKYLNYTQAVAISNDYSKLREEHPEGPSIAAILPAPYSRILQWDYVRNLRKGHTAQALLQQYPGGRYDVIVLTLDAAKPGGYAIEDLRSFLERNEMSFDIKRYDALRRV